MNKIIAEAKETIFIIVGMVLSLAFLLLLITFPITVTLIMMTISYALDKYGDR